MYKKNYRSHGSNSHLLLQVIHVQGQITYRVSTKKYTQAFLEKDEVNVYLSVYPLHNVMHKPSNYWTYTNHTTTSPVAIVGLAKNRHYLLLILHCSA